MAMAISNTCDVRLFCEEMKRTSKSPHVAMFPAAGMGPLTPFLHLARTLAIEHGFSVTFIVAQNNVSHSETVHVKALASSGLDIRLAEIEVEPVAAVSVGEDGETMSDDPFFMQWEALGRSMAAFETVLTKLARPPPSSSSFLPASAIITEALLSPTVDVTAKLNIPNYIFVAASAFMLALMLYSPALISRPEPDSCHKNGNSGLHIPGLPPLSAADIPEGLKTKDHVFLRVFVCCASKLPKAAGVLINTFYGFETEILDALSAGWVVEGLPPIHPIGPTVLYSIPYYSAKTNINADADSARCLQWLDAQPPGSVLYVSFGSRSLMSAEQANEVALGLERSGQNFLWVVRASVVTSASRWDVSTILPPGFESRVRDRGLVVSCWVPQVGILSHPSVGGFVSHCGWNSTMESVSCGIPMIAWPLFGDQMMNARFLVEIAKMAMAVKKGIGGMVSRDEVERAVRSLMIGEEGKALKRRATELRDCARKSIAGGSSRQNLNQVIDAMCTSSSG